METEASCDWTSTSTILLPTLSGTEETTPLTALFPLIWIEAAGSSDTAFTSRLLVALGTFRVYAVVKGLKAGLMPPGLTLKSRRFASFGYG
ncbi:hypothetical protein D3C75_945090 [compost metagenome]